MLDASDKAENIYSCAVALLKRSGVRRRGFGGFTQFGVKVFLAKSPRSHL